jgi:hypothetical protein
VTGTVGSNGDVYITETQQMTAAAGKAIFELTIDGMTHGTANFIVQVEKKPTDDAVLSESDLSIIQQGIDSVTPAAINETVSEYLAEHMTNPPIDPTLTVSNAAADAKVTGDKVTELKTALYDMSEGYTWQNGYYALGTGVWTPQTETVTYHSTNKLSGKIPSDDELINSGYMSGDSFYPVWLGNTYKGYLMDDIWRNPNGSQRDTAPQYDTYAIVLHNVTDYQGFRNIIYYKKSEMMELAKHSVLIGQVVQAGFSPETDSWTYGYPIRCGITTIQYAITDLYIHCGSGYQVVAYYRNAQDESIEQSGWQSGVFKIDGGTYYYLQFRKYTNENISPSEVIENFYISNTSDETQNYPISKAIEYITIPKSAVNALVNLLNHVAYVDTHGQQYIDTLIATLSR